MDLKRKKRAAIMLGINLSISENLAILVNSAAKCLLKFI